MKFKADASFQAALLAAILVIVWQAAVVRAMWGGNWTGLFCAGSQVEMPAEAARGLFRVPDSGGYDAQYYRLIARDPFFVRGYQRYIDDARLRYRRILLPLAAHAISFGQDRFVDAAYILCVLLSIFFGVLWTGRWFEQQGRNGWYGLLFLVVPAVLTSIDRMLLDGPLCALFAGFAWKLTKGERPWSILLCAPLMKETGLFLAAAVCVTDLRSRRWKSALAVMATQLPALLWFAFVHAHTPSSRAEVILARPVIGQVERLLTPRSYAPPGAMETALRTVDAVAILSLLASSAIAIVWFWPYVTAVELATVLFALLGLGLGSSVHLIEAYGFSRPVSPFLWYLLVHSVAQRRWLFAAVPLGLTAAVGVTPLNETIRVVRAFVG